MISVIIPALNEAKALPRTLAALGDALAQLHASAPAFAGRQVEIILVDGGSNDATIAAAERWSAGSGHPIRVLSAARGRATQMNAGARHGSSEKILPGFMMFFGSSARLMWRIIATAPGPASSSR